MIIFGIPLPDPPLSSSPAFWWDFDSGCLGSWLGFARRFGLHLDTSLSSFIGIDQCPLGLVWLVRRCYLKSDSGRVQDRRKSIFLRWERSCLWICLKCWTCEENGSYFFVCCFELDSSFLHWVSSGLCSSLQPLQGLWIFPWLCFMSYFRVHFRAHCPRVCALFYFLLLYSDIVNTSFLVGGFPPYSLIPGKGFP